MTAQPASTQPASTQPASTQPASTQPASTQPASTQPASSRPASSRTATRVGLALSALAVLFLVFDSIGKLLRIPDVVAATEQLGYPAATVPVMGGVLLGCVILYVVPRTAVLGAVALTGYLGGAAAAQLRVEAPLFSTLLFAVYVGVVVWAGLYLRSSALRALVRVGS